LTDAEGGYSSIIKKIWFCNLAEILSASTRIEASGEADSSKYYRFLQAEEKLVRRA